MWKRVVGYEALLAAGTLALQWLDYERLARMHAVQKKGARDNFPANNAQFGQAPAP